MFGGGNGFDLLRSGEDLGSAFRLNLSTWVRREGWGRGDQRWVGEAAAAVLCCDLLFRDGMGQEQGQGALVV